MADTIILKILNSKYTYIITSVILLVICITLTVSLIKNKVSYEKQKEFERKIENLEIEKSILAKNLENEKQKVLLENSFTNSQDKIEKIGYKELNENEKNAFTSVSNDYYSFMLAH